MSNPAITDLVIYIDANGTSHAAIVTGVVNPGTLHLAVLATDGVSFRLGVIRGNTGIHDRWIPKP